MHYSTFRKEIWYTKENLHLPAKGRTHLARNPRGSQTDEDHLKDLSFCHKRKCSNPYIFAT